MPVSGNVQRSHGSIYGGRAPGAVDSFSLWTPYTGVFNASDKATGATVSASGFQLTSDGAAVGGARGTVALSGKVYWSVVVYNLASTTTHTVGVANSSLTISGTSPNDSANGWGYYGNNGHILNNSDTAYGNSFTLGDLITVAVDVPAASIWWAKNGVWQNSGNPLTGANPAFTNLSGTLYPWCGNITAAAAQYVIAPPGQTAVGLA